MEKSSVNLKFGSDLEFDSLIFQLEYERKKKKKIPFQTRTPSDVNLVTRYRSQRVNWHHLLLLSCGKKRYVWIRFLTPPPIFSASRIKIRVGKIMPRSYFKIWPLFYWLRFLVMQSKRKLHHQIQRIREPYCRCIKLPSAKLWNFLPEEIPQIKISRRAGFLE